MIKITAAIITKNEQRCIKRCLESLLWVDQIVVVDSFSTDQTSEICQDANAPWASLMSFHQRKWSGFNDQRTFCLEKATNDWILVLDADEACSPELISKLKEWKKTTPPHPAYKIRRIEYFLGKPIKHGIWNPSYQDRFFNKKGVYYKNEIHEYPVFPVLPQQIHEPILHDPTFNIDRFITKMNQYTSIEAQDRYNQGQRTHLLKIFFAIPAMFYKNWIYYGAYKDGVHGVIISLLEGVSRFVRHVKMWQIQNKDLIK
ncbi:MAG: hypothetical protein CL678_10935 [Bdellovibrionaceae bacterium]|nr:hypothetical protein [Pseudobdellovibrionaceae bacterium]|tara:strand:- start:235 stop:1008 length:774 start_codon:yes stop_codon:yes gene_type:complete